MIHCDWQRLTLVKQFFIVYRGGEFLDYSGKPSFYNPAVSYKVYSFARSNISKTLDALVISQN